MAAPAARPTSAQVRACSTGRRWSTTWRPALLGCAKFLEKGARGLVLPAHGRHDQKRDCAPSRSPARVKKTGGAPSAGGDHGGGKLIAGVLRAGMLAGHQVSTPTCPGGASGGILPASLVTSPLDFDTLQPYGLIHRARPP